MTRRLWTIPITAALAIATVFPAVSGAAEQRFPDVVDVRVQARAGERFDFDVTVSSPYDTPQRYADAFRVTDAAGKVYGERKLLHDHANEQPFTRDLYGVLVPRGVRTVVVQARDRKHGYGGKTVRVTLPGRQTAPEPDSSPLSAP